MSERSVSITRRSRPNRQTRPASFAELLEPRRFLATTTSFLAAPPTVPYNSVLFANFDNGGEGVAFHDHDDRNLGGEYRRKKSGVDIERSHDELATNLGGAPGSGRSVGYVRAGEFLKYTVNVATDGIYTFRVRFASSTGGTAHLDVDGVDRSGTFDLPRTGGWKEWKTISKAGVVLRSGTHVLKFQIDSAAKLNGEVGNLHWFTFTRTGDAPDPLPWPKAWKRIDDAPFARYEATTHVFKDKAYLFGGYKDGEFHVSREYRVLNPATNTWTSLGSLPSGLSETHAGVADDGKYIYLVGGFSGNLNENNSPPQVGSKRVFRYNPATNQWSEIANLPRAQGAGGAAIVGRTLHFFGGNSADRVTNVGNHYVMNLDDLGAGWKTAAPMPDPKDHFSTVVVNNKIYAIAGEYGHDRDFNTQKTMDVYDPANNSWRRLASMPIENSHAEGSTFAYNGQIIFAGGQTKDRQLSTDRVFAYDPVKNQWRERYRLPNYLQGAIVMVVGNKVYVTQGARFTETALPQTFVGTVG